MSRVYHKTTPLIYKNIDQEASVRLVFLSGLGSPIRQQKEAFFRRFALTNGISYTALDYTRLALQNKSSENFQIPTFTQKTMTLFASFPERKLLLFGGCFGGLMGLVMTQKMPQKIAGAVLTSPAYELPSFPWVQKADTFLHQKTQEMLKERKTTFAQLKRLAVLHMLFMTTTKTVAKTPLIKNYQGPITIFHGQKDPLIPAENSFRIQQALENPNLQLCIIPNMKHTLACDKEMKRPISVLKQYLNNIKSPSN